MIRTFVVIDLIVLSAMLLFAASEAPVPRIARTLTPAKAAECSASAALSNGRFPSPSARRSFLPGSGREGLGVTPWPGASGSAPLTVSAAPRASNTRRHDTHALSRPAPGNQSRLMFTRITYQEHPPGCPSNSRSPSGD